MRQSVCLPAGLHVRWTSVPLASERKIEPPFHEIVGVVLYRHRRRVLSIKQSRCSRRCSFHMKKLDDPVNPRSKDVLPDCPNVPYLKTSGPSRCRFGVGRDTTSDMLRHVKPHPIVHVDPLCDRTCGRVQGRKGPVHASCSASEFTSGKKPETGQIANHVRPNVGQPAFEQSCQTCRATFWRGNEAIP